MRALAATLGLLLLVPHLAHAGPRAKLAERVAELEARLAALEARVGAAAATAAAPDDVEERAAAALYQQATSAHAAGDVDGALALLRRIGEAHPETRAAAPAARLSEQLAVLGRAVEALPVQRWLHGEASLGDGVTLLVFWEPWCPHCRRELPRLQDTFARLEPQGLSLLSLTRLSRGSTEDEVLDLVRAHDVTFPVGLVDDAFARQLAVTGVPAAAVLRGREVIWRGHPALLTDEVLARWLADEE